MIRNVGFGEDATHTTDGEVKTDVFEGIDPNRHPSLLLRDIEADAYTFNNSFGGKWKRFPLSFVRFLKKSLLIIVRFR